MGERFGEQQPSFNDDEWVIISKFKEKYLTDPGKFTGIESKIAQLQLYKELFKEEEMAVAEVGEILRETYADRNLLSQRIRFWKVEHEQLWGNLKLLEQKR